MKNIWNKLLIAFIFILVLTLTVLLQKKVSPTVSTAKEIQTDLEKANCENKNRLEDVKRLFNEMGASDNDLEIVKFEDPDVKNLVVTKKGKTDETVIIGAHYDKTSSGCGVIDNWSGIVIIAHIYRRIKDVTPNKTYKFVAFGKEELGLLGSRAMAKSIPENERENYCAMINFDSFGFSYPQALGNASDKSLIKIAEETSESLKIPFSSLSVLNASSDSVSFQKIDVPAITVHGLSNNWKDFLHQDKDKIKYLEPKSVHIGYLYALQFLSKIETAGCADLL